jgi:hypothetical protein
LPFSLGNIPDTIFNELKKHFSDSQIVGRTSLAAFYNMINYFNEALKLDPKERVKAFADKVIGDMAGAMAAGMGYMDTKTGLFHAMAGKGPLQLEDVVQE